MIEWIFRTADGINSNLGHATAVRALLVGLVVSIGLTQIAKFSPQLVNTTDATARLMTRIFAFFSAAIPCWALWPEPGAAGIVVAFALGVIAPALYTIVVRIAVHFWPWLDGKVSARPGA